jgi:hypothetical protein
MPFYSSPLGDPVVVKDTGDVVVYQYPVYGTEYDEGTLDDNSLAAHDALKLVSDGDRDMPHNAREAKRRKSRRRILLLVALCLLLGIIVVTSVLTNRKNKDEQNDTTDANRLEGGGYDQVPTTSPIEAQDTSAPTNTLETPPPTEELTMATLRPVVHDPSLLLDRTTSEGQAFASVSAEDLSNPQRIIQRYSLLTFFFAADGDDWIHNSGWNQQSSDECTWYGTDCSNGDVTTLSLCKLFEKKL